MALPITWKNVAQPRTASANALLMAGYKATSNAPMVGGQVLKDASERIKGENTEDGVSMASQLNNLDTFGSDRRGVMEQFLNKNVNEAALSKALDDRQQFLQGNQKFEQGNELHGLNLAAKQFDVDNQVDDRNLDRRRIMSNMATNAANRKTATTVEQARQFNEVIGAYKDYTEDGTLQFDDAGYTEALRSNGLDVVKGATHLKSYLQSSGLTDARKIAADFKKANKGTSSVMTAPKDIQPDSWDLDTRGTISVAWKRRAQQLKDDGYTYGQIQSIMAKGYGNWGGWDENRKELVNAIRDIEPLK